MNEIPLNYDHYREVLEYPYQWEEKQPKTFLEIARQLHYENVISNMLAFFFDTSEEHGMRDLFLSSLLAVVEEKAAIDFSMHNCTAEREYRTLKQGRIDLLLTDGSGTMNLAQQNRNYSKGN